MTPNRFGWLCWYFVVNTIAFALLSLRYLEVDEVPPTFTAQGFFVLMSLGHLGTLSLILLLPAFLVACFHRMNTVSIAVAVIAMSTMTAFLLIDSSVFALYRIHVNRPLVDMFFGSASKEIFVLSTVTYVRLWAILVGIVAGQSLVAVYLRRKTSPLSSPRALPSFLTVAFLLLHNLIYAAADSQSYTPITQQAQILPGYFPTTMHRLFDRLGLSSDTANAAIPQSVEDPSSALNYPTRELECSAPAVPKNVLFLVIDSWRFDMLTPEITPNMAKFSETAMNFDNHTSGGSCTRTGIFTMLYGLTADYWHQFLRERKGPEMLRQFLERDYQMAIYGSSPWSSPEFDETVFVDVPNLRIKSDGESSADRDKNITDRFIEFLSARDKSKPFFGFLFYDAPHAFSVPRNYQGPFQPALPGPDYLALNQSYDPTRFLNLYKNSIHYDDELIGRVIKQIQEAGLLDDTVIVITGDHGQEFNENGKNYWGHSGNFTRYQAGVPLAIWWPGREAKRYLHRTNHIDIVPTIMQDLFNCKNDIATYSFGQNLRNESERKFFLLGNYGEQALVEKDKMTLLHEFGGTEVVDNKLNPLANQQMSGEILKRFLTMRAAFLKP